MSGFLPQPRSRWNWVADTGTSSPLTLPGIVKTTLWGWISFVIVFSAPFESAIEQNWTTSIFS